MKLLVAIGAAVVTLLLFSCHHVTTADGSQIYNAWEDGLTLVFENATLSNSNACTKKQQVVRVERAISTPMGLVVIQAISSPRGMRTVVVNKNGGVATCTDSSCNNAILLPDGFPDTVTQWGSDKSFSRIVGRATTRLPGVHLVDDFNNTGIWVETIHLDQENSRTRTLYLPNIGEVETMLWDHNKRCWTTTRRLIYMSFTDASILPVELLKVS